MKNRWKAVAVLICFFSAAAIYAQEEMSMEEAFEMAQPGPEHELLNKLTGKWSLAVTMFGMPGTEPVKAVGSSYNEMIIGGRFLQMKANSEMMGMTTDILQIMGFDKRSGKYTIVGFDSFGTYYITAAGDYNESEKTITMFGSDSLHAPGTSGNYKFVIIIPDEKSFTMEIHFETPDNTYMKGVEVVYTKD